MADRDALADSVTAVRFPSARFRQGYSAGDVDAFLTDLATTIRAGGPVRERVGAAQFRQEVGGYDMGAVDDVLDRTAEAADSGHAAGGVPASVVAAELPSAISTGDGALVRALTILPVLGTALTFGFVAGIAGAVVRHVWSGTPLPVWPSVVAGFGLGLVYRVIARVFGGRRSSAG